jgi:hypothetical protein
MQNGKYLDFWPYLNQKSEGFYEIGLACFIIIKISEIIKINLFL